MNRPDEIWNAGFITGRKIQDTMSYGASQLKDMLPMGMHGRRQILDWFDDLRMKLLSACESMPPQQRPATGGMPGGTKSSAAAPDQVPDSRAQYHEYQQRLRGGKAE